MKDNVIKIDFSKSRKKKHGKFNLVTFLKNLFNNIFSPTRENSSNKSISNKKVINYSKYISW